MCAFDGARPGASGACATAPSSSAALALSKSQVGGIVGGVLGSFALLCVGGCFAARAVLRRRAAAAGWRAFVASADEVVMGERLGSGGCATIYVLIFFFLLCVYSQL